MAVICKRVLGEKQMSLVTVCAFKLATLEDSCDGDRDGRPGKSYRCCDCGSTSKRIQTSATASRAPRARGGRTKERKKERKIRNICELSGT